MISHLDISKVSDDGEFIKADITLAGDGYSNKFYVKAETSKVAYIPSIDFALIMALFKAMEKGGTLYVHGDVSASLLDGIEEFQNLYIHWYENTGWLHRVEVIPDKEIELSTAGVGGYMQSCTMGVDSLYSALTHIYGRGHKQRGLLDMASLLYIKGLDAPSNSPDHAELIKQIHNTIPNFPVAIAETNVRRIYDGRKYDLMFGAILVGVANLFSASYDGFLISPTYNFRLLPTGVNAYATPFLGTATFNIAYDTPIARSHKLKRLHDSWPEAYHKIKPCWQGKRQNVKYSVNCGVCGKCIRTLLSAEIMGIPKPNSIKNRLKTNWMGVFQSASTGWTQYIIILDEYRWLREQGYTGKLMNKYGLILQQLEPKIMEAIKQRVDNNYKIF